VSHSRPVERKQRARLVRRLPGKVDGARSNLWIQPWLSATSRCSGRTEVGRRESPLTGEARFQPRAMEVKASQETRSNHEASASQGQMVKVSKPSRLGGLLFGATCCGGGNWMRA
jgi:hypothetical protein